MPKIVELSFRSGNDSHFKCGLPFWRDADGGYVDPSVDFIDKTALMLIHGYNTGDPRPAYSKLEAYWGSRYDIIIRVYWPGGFAPSFLADNKLVHFILSKFVKTDLFDRADMVGRGLASLGSYLKVLKSLDIQAHSLGNRVLLEALRWGLSCRTAILCAAAVDNESVENGQKYEKAMQSVTRGLIAFSHSDPALLAYIPVEFDKPLGLHGPEHGGSLIPGNWELLCRDGDTHGKYREDPIYLSRVQELCWKSG